MRYRNITHIMYSKTHSLLFFKYSKTHSLYSKTHSLLKENPVNVLF